MEKVPKKEMENVEREAREYPDIASDVIYTNLKLDLITERAKNKMLLDIIDELRRITGINAGRWDQTDFRKGEQENYLQSQSMEADRKKLMPTELNYCLYKMGGNLLEKRRR